jgi:VIT1/CCC1 family predicted Fe2+/Mn2+ transporter
MYSAISINHEPASSSEHLGKQRQYWRDIILGVNDGLVSTFLLISGVSGGKLSSNQILLTAISGALAGSVSMFAGEFMATKTQDEVLSGELKMEEKHIRDYHQEEVEELDKLLTLIGIPENPEKGRDAIRSTLTEYYASNEEALLKIMVALEFGILENERRQPIVAGIASGSLFFVGSLPSMIPFALLEDPSKGFIWATICTGISLFAVGYVKTFVARESYFVSAFENLLIAGLGGIAAYVIGVIFEHFLGGGSP